MPQREWLSSQCEVAAAAGRQLIQPASNGVVGLLLSGCICDEGRHMSGLSGSGCTCRISLGVMEHAGRVHGSEAIEKIHWAHLPQELRVIAHF